MSVDASAGTRVYPELTGADAEPGALVEIVDDHGAVWGRTEADGAGRWSVSDLSSAAASADPAASLPAGEHRLSPRQLVGGRASPTGAWTSIEVAAPPSLVSPASGSAVSAAGFSLTVDGIPGATVQRARIGDAVPWRGDLMPLDGTGRFSTTYRIEGGAGPVTLAVRYVDPATGRFGPASVVSFTAF